MSTENKGVNPAEDRVQELQKMYTSFNEQEKLTERLTQTVFPHALHPDLEVLFFKTRFKATPATLGGSVDNYLKLMRMTHLNALTYMDAASILNFVESLSAEAAGCIADANSFVEVLEHCHRVAKENWTPDVNVWREAIAEEKVKLKEFVQAEIAKVNASIKGKKNKGKHAHMNHN